MPARRDRGSAGQPSPRDEPRRTATRRRATRSRSRTTSTTNTTTRSTSGAPVDSVVRSTTSARVVPAAALVSGRRRRLGTCAEPDARRALGALARRRRPDQPASSAASRVRDAARDEGRRMQRLLAAPDLLARGRLSGQQVRAAAAADPTPPGDQGGGEIHHQMARRPRLPPTPTRVRSLLPSPSPAVHATDP